jgi:DNA polymerase III epsilon subunit-like protein
MNGFNQSDWDKSNVTIDAALGGIFNLMRGNWHAGSNPVFDERFLKKAANKLCWDYPKTASHHLIDVTMLPFNLLIDNKVESLRQEKLADYYQIKGGGHRALSDALQCCEIFARINNLKVDFSGIK